MHPFSDERLIPNPPTDIDVKEDIDMRIGFFGYVILNISWERPQSITMTMKINSTTKNVFT